eukprot:scaffold33549_cov72-Phaeocystis_antarctica.AAC.3
MAWRACWSRLRAAAPTAAPRKASLLPRWGRSRAHSLASRRRELAAARSGARTPWWLGVSPASGRHSLATARAWLARSGAQRSAESSRALSRRSQWRHTHRSCRWPRDSASSVASPSQPLGRRLQIGPWARRSASWLASASARRPTSAGLSLSSPSADTVVAMAACRRGRKEAR